MSRREGSLRRAVHKHARMIRYLSEFTVLVAGLPANTRTPVAVAQHDTDLVVELNFDDLISQCSDLGHS